MDGVVEGAVAGDRKLVLVSWYYKSAEKRGVRISFAASFSTRSRVSALWSLE